MVSVATNREHLVNLQEYSNGEMCYCLVAESLLDHCPRVSQIVVEAMSMKKQVFSR